MKSSERSRSRSLVAIVSIAVAVVVVLAGALFVFGTRGVSNDTDADRNAPPASTATTTPSTTTPDTTTPDTTIPGKADNRVRKSELLVLAASADPLSSSPVVDALEDGDVLRIRVTDLRPGSRGKVEQCVRAPTGFEACENEFPIQASEDGTAYFQYQLLGDARSCDVAASCVVVATDDTDREAVAYTLFGAEAPEPAAVRLRPARPYRAGESIVVHIEDLPPGAPVGVAFCAPDCRTPASATADESGTARVPLVLGSGCDRGDRCVVFVTGLASRDTATPVQFIAAPTARYDVRRTAFGLGIAVLLLVAAWVIVRRTDWHVPTEAATPALDSAEL